MMILINCMYLICLVNWILTLGWVKVPISPWTPNFYTKHLISSKISESLLGIWEQNLTSFVENHKTRKRKTKSARKCEALIWVKKRTGGFGGSNPDQLKQEEKRNQSCKSLWPREFDTVGISSYVIIVMDFFLPLVCLVPLWIPVNFWHPYIMWPDHFDV